MLRVAIAQFDGATSLRVPPLAAGLLASTLRQRFQALSLSVHVRRTAVDDAARILAQADVAGLSLYAWNRNYALAVARRARELRPALRIIAGGPSVPRRPEAYARFLAEHPWIEALVLGEGEQALCDVIEAIRADAPLTTIPGVIARSGDAIVAGPPRARLEGAAFANIGSPYLDGTFDELVACGELAAIHAVVLETNRGCPFSCAFCDWGQATQSKVNELPSDRIERELAWIGERRVPYLYLVDANFGIRRRDVEITESIGRASQRWGAPGFVFFHLTKNATAKNLKTVEILRAHGVGTQVALSMQDFDREVLVAIKRDNIRPDAALALREHCHARGLSTVNELMLGLPAQTAASIRASVVAGITPFPKDTFFLYPTRVLENAELAEPAYRARHGLETRMVAQWPTDPTELPHVMEYEEIVVATSSLTVDDWAGAFAFGYLLSALWNQRLLQTTIHVVRFALERDLAGFIDALLASSRPRLATIRGELARYARAIFEGEGTTLVVPGWGAQRREPAEAVCALVHAAPAEFHAEVAEEAARWIGAEDAALVRDAVRWDAVQLPARAGLADFAYDWIAYEAAMSARKPPIATPIRVRATAPPPLGDEAGVSSGWHMQARNIIEAVGQRLVAVDRDEAALRSHAERDGCVYVPRALPLERLAALGAVVDRALASRGWVVDGKSDPALRLGRWDDSRWLEFLGEVLGSQAYRELAAAPELLALLRPILGGEPQLNVGDVCRLVSPGAIDLTTPPHQDAAYLADAHEVWTAWIPLGPCPIELGPLALLPGSHREGVRPHAAVERGGDQVVGTDVPADAPWRSASLAAGDVILFSALTVHCALPNLTRDQLRVSVDFRYRRAR